MTIIAAAKHLRRQRQVLLSSCPMVEPRYDWAGFRRMPDLMRFRRRADGYRHDVRCKHSRRVPLKSSPTTNLDIDTLGCRKRMPSDIGGVWHETSDRVRWWEGAGIGEIVASWLTISRQLVTIIQ